MRALQLSLLLQLVAAVAVAQTQPSGKHVPPGGVVGNDRELGSDAQPPWRLPADPLATERGSSAIAVTSPGCCARGGLVAVWPQTWIMLENVAPVGGITPTGWLKVGRILNDDSFEVQVPEPARETARGGGNAVVVRRSIPTQAEKLYSIATTGASGYPIQRVSLFVANPLFFQEHNGPQFQARWSMVFSPPDDSGKHSFGTVGEEFDFTNRGDDVGYSPNLYAASRPTIGLWYGPNPQVPDFAAGGGAAHNWNTVYSVFSNNGVVGVYDGYSVQPNALVGAARDPTGHGGVGADIFGSYQWLPPRPFATHAGSGTITVAVWRGALDVQSVGDMVYLPARHVIGGVAFGGRSYRIEAIDRAKGTFEIAGEGLATGDASGGGADQPAYFANLVPYAPTQFWGEFRHGLISTNARFDSGGIVETQPGNGILWRDEAGVASVNGRAAGEGNIDVVLATAGNGVIRLENGIALSDSGAAPISAARATIPASYEIALFDAGANAIVATIQACNAGRRWDQVFKDATGHAAEHHIVLTASGGTIDGAASAVIDTARGVVHLHSNGAACFVL